MRFFAILLLVFSACDDTVVFETDESLPDYPFDASSSRDATLDATPPDASAPDARLCLRPTTGVIVGDSIAQNLYTNARTLLPATAYKNAVAGATVADQLATWQASPLRGTPIDWFYVEGGINDTLHGTETSTAVSDDMNALLTNIHTSNPTAVVFVVTMDPARKKLDLVAANRYPYWQTLNASYVTRFAARNDVSAALNDGNDNLRPEYDNGDGLHPNPGGDRVTAAILAGWITETFSTPCN